jgi:hypothetical protein
MSSSFRLRREIVHADSFCRGLTALKSVWGVGDDVEGIADLGRIVSSLGVVDRVLADGCSARFVLLVDAHGTWGGCRGPAWALTIEDDSDLWL